jgi:hypothetical protein
VLEPFQFKQQVRNDRIGNKLTEFIERQTTEVLTPKNLSHCLHTSTSPFSLQTDFEALTKTKAKRQTGHR